MITLNNYNVIATVIFQDVDGSGNGVRKPKGLSKAIDCRDRTRGEYVRLGSLYRHSCRLEDARNWNEKWAEYRTGIDGNKMLESILDCRRGVQRHLGYTRKRLIERERGNRQHSLLNDVGKKNKRRRQISDYVW
jgi:hypothetical protein